MARTDLEMLVYQMDADISRLTKSTEKAVALATGGAKKIQHEYDDLGKQLDRSFGAGNFGKAAADSIGELRGKVIGAAGDIPLLGGALGSLGLAGLLAAGSVGAINAVLEHSEKAVEYGAAIGKLATVVGVSTNFIQEFNFAARQSEIDVASADGAIKGLNESLGAVQANLPRSERIAKVFAAIGFTPNDLRQFHDVGDLLPVLADRIAAIGNAAEQAAVAKRLGVSDLLPLLREGGAAFNKLAQEARDLGIVMDGALIEKSEEAKRKLSELDDIMKSRANITFAKFADTLISVKTAFAGAEEAGLSFLSKITGTQPIEDHLAELRGAAQRLGIRQIAGQKLSPTEQGKLDQYNSQIQALELQSAIQREILGPKPPPPASATAAHELLPSTPKHQKADRTSEAIDQALKDELGAHASLLQAILAQGGSLDQQLDLERQIYAAKRGEVAAETAKKLKETADSKDIQSGKKVQIEAAIKAAEADKLAALDAEETRKVRDLELTARKRALVQAQILAGFDEEALTLEADLATTRKERVKLEADALALRQKQERDRLSGDYDQKIADKTASPEEKAAGLAALDRTQTLQTQQFNKQNAGPLATYLSGLHDLDTEMRTAGVQALSSLSSGLAEAIANGKNLGDVFKSVTRQMIADVIQMELKQLTGSLFGGAAGALLSIAGHAQGGDFTVGGISGIDNNIVPMRLSAGERVSITPQGKMRTGSGGGGGALVFDLRGAVMTADLIDQMSQMAHGAATGTYVQVLHDRSVASRQGSRRLG